MDLDREFIRQAVLHGFLEEPDGERLYRKAHAARPGSVGRMLVKRQRMTREEALGLYLLIGSIPCPRCCHVVPIPEDGTVLACGGCAKKFRLPDEAPGDSCVGRRLGDYQVLEKVGQGGMGDLYRAIHPGLDKLFAIKVIAPECTRNRAYLERFRREARIAARIDHHNTIGIVTVGHQDGLHYLVMPFVDGDDLGVYVEQYGALEPAEATRVMTQLARGLKAIHDQGILHRDIKPANVLVDRSGKVLLGDFGLAREAEGASLTQNGVILGTPQYMSPEQCDGEAIDHRSDLYNLGVTLYFLLHGKPPFEEDSPMAVMLKQKTESPPIDRRVRRRAGDLIVVLERLAEKSPDDRYQSADELLVDLERIARGEPIVARRRPAARGRQAAFAAGLALLLLGAALGVWYRQRPAGPPPGPRPSGESESFEALVERVFRGRGRPVAGVVRGVRVELDEWGDADQLERLLDWHRGPATGMRDPAKEPAALRLEANVAAGSELRLFLEARFVGTLQIEADVRLVAHDGKPARVGLRLFEQVIHGKPCGVFLGLDRIDGESPFELLFVDDLRSHEGVTRLDRGGTLEAEPGELLRIRVTVREGSYQLQVGTGTHIVSGPVGASGPCGLVARSFRRLDVVRLAVEGQLDPRWIAAQRR